VFVCSSLRRHDLFVVCRQPRPESGPASNGTSTGGQRRTTIRRAAIRAAAGPLVGSARFDEAASSPYGWRGAGHAGRLPQPARRWI
jgi:hypothetical protein